MQIFIKFLFLMTMCFQTSAFGFFRYYFKYYTPTDGLLSLKVSASVQDKTGYMWFATSAGLMRYDGYQYISFLRKEGLPSNIITHLLVDRDRLWVGTLEGLCSIDTKTLKVTNTEITNRITVLYQDRSQRIWVGQESGDAQQLVIVNKSGEIREHIFATQHPQFPQTFITSILETMHGIFWFGTEDGVHTIDSSNPENKPFYRASRGEFPAKNVLAIQEDKEQIIFGTNDGLVYFTGQKFHKHRLSKSSASYKVKHIHIDHEGRLWAATDKGIKVLPQNRDLQNIESYTVEQGLSHNEVTHIFADRERSVWISTNGGGISKLYDENILHYNIFFNGKNRGVYSILENTQNKTLWFGGEGIIAHLSNKKEWTVASQETVVGGSYIKNIFLDPKGELWFLASDLSHLLQDNKILPYSRDFFFNEFDLLNYLPVLLADGSYEIWFGTVQGVYVFWSEARTVPIQQFLDAELNDKRIVSLIFDHTSHAKSPPPALQFKDSTPKITNPFALLKQSLTQKNSNTAIMRRPQLTSDIWIATQQHGLYKLNKNRQLTPYKNNHEISQRDIHKIYQDSHGNIWILFSNGVSVIDHKTEALRHYTMQNGLPTDFAWHITEDQSGNIWLATNGGGIVIFTRNNTLKYYSKKHGLSDDYVYKILIDQSSPKLERVWIITNYALNYYDGQRFTSYNKHNGLNGDLLGEATPLFMDHEHNIWVGTSNGVTEIKNRLTHKLTKPSGTTEYKPKLRLQKLFINEKSAPLALKESLSYDQNYLTFEFVTLSFKDEDGVRYQYYLEGFQKNWSLLTQESTIRYDNLPSGDYTLHVRAQTQEGQWTDEYRKSFTIALPFWQHPAFILSVLILFIATAYILYKWNIRRLKQQNLLLEQKVQQRTQELSKEKEKSDKLLLNVLPYPIAEELKKTGYTIPQTYQQTTILFTDFAGFTKISERLSAQELVLRLEEYFSYFDGISKRCNLEKLKTIGDAYMAAGGLPEVNATHPLDAILAAAEFLNFVIFMGEKKASESQSAWHIRIGIHTGTVVAGVVGKSKFAYDIWGDAVNMASRMESSGAPNHINISQETYALIKDFFDCEYRGFIEAKNKGQQKMYFVHSLKEKYRQSKTLFEPNESFWEDYRDYAQAHNEPKNTF